jgi:hypothetical protein
MSITAVSILGIALFILALSPSHILGALPDPANHEPVIISQPITTVAAGQPYSYDVNAVDPDNDTLTLNLITAPADLTINSASGAISWNPAGTDLGKHAVRLRVEDGRSKRVTQTIDSQLRERKGIKGD